MILRNIVMKHNLRKWVNLVASVPMLMAMALPGAGQASQSPSATPDLQTAQVKSIEKPAPDAMQVFNAAKRDVSRRNGKLFQVTGVVTAVSDNSITVLGSKVKNHGRE